MTRFMEDARRVVVIALLPALLWSAGASPSYADAKSTLAVDAAEYVVQRFGRQAVREGTESLAARIEVYAARHGDEFYAAVRKVGPSAFRLVEEGGEHAPQVVGILSRYGEDGAVWVVSRPRAMNLFLEHGEEAAAVLAKTRGVAEPAIAALGKPSVNAFASLTTGQSARRLAMLAEGGELTASGRASDVLGVIAKYGDPAMDFLWRHKEVFASGALLAAFIADPEPFINGVKDITKAVVEEAAKPLAEASGKIAIDVASVAVRNIDWNLVFKGLLAILLVFVIVRFCRKWWRRHIW
jgi:hypothetical protein